MTFSISALVSPRDSHIKPDSQDGGICVEGWYQGRYEKFHVIIYLSHILHWPFPSIDFYNADKIFELRNCENKSLRELPLFNWQIFLFRVWFRKEIKQCRSVQWTLENVCKIYPRFWHLNGNPIQIPTFFIQHDVYIWANYSVSIELYNKLFQYFEMC
jgi:hypothetical protein